jgi:hypothetical protein
MKLVRSIVLGMLLMPVSLSLIADELIKIDSMNYPAWVVRNYETLPLFPGFQLQTNDLVRTGTRGRLLIKMADGSAIKLGHMARFRIESSRLDDVNGESFFNSSFQALRGAFRFTSSFFGNASLRHRVDVKVGAITAGIRGTDIWGRSNQQQDLVCLIEGVITVTADDGKITGLQQPLSFYVKPKGEPALPVDMVDSDQLRRWAEETELDSSLGIASNIGEWQLVLISLTEIDNANEALEEFQKKGFAVRKISVVRNGRTLHRLILRGFITIEDALSARAMVKDELGIADAWVWKAR